MIFVNGCFWHGHEGCKHFVWPKSNEEFWKNKIETNIARDKKKTQVLEELGWRVIVVWECELKKATINETFKKLIDELSESSEN